MTTLPCYSDTAECRKKARSVPTNHFTDPQINVIQNQVYSTINQKLHKQGDPYQPTDDDFPAIQLIELNWVVGELWLYYAQDPFNAGVGQKMIDEMKAELQEFKADTEEPPEDLESIIGHTERKSWNLNSNVPVPRGGLRIM